jgi:prepilin-type N-terminal cleavage/methylation domain-containing protein
MTRQRSNRRGMTLVEVMIALVLLGIVSGVIMRVVLRQQRFYQGVNEIMTQRGQLRSGTSVLPVDLRSLSSIGEDILAVSDSAIEFDMNIGTSFVCETVVGGKVMVLPPKSTGKGNYFTSIAPGVKLEVPEEVLRGVTVYVYNDSSTLGNFDDVWQKLSLVKYDSTKAFCITPVPAYVDVFDAGEWRYTLEVTDTTGTVDNTPGGTNGPISRYVGPGAPIRIMKRVRYALYQEADSKWYVGYSEFDKVHGKYGELTPVSGPYEPYATGSGTATGFLFRYFDVDGVEIAPGANTADRARIARIDLVARARTASNVRTEGIQRGVSQQYKDSLAVSVMLRNRQ